MNKNSIKDTMEIEITSSFPLEKLTIDIVNPLPIIKKM